MVVRDPQRRLELLELFDVLLTFLDQKLEVLLLLLL